MLSIHDIRVCFGCSWKWEITVILFYKPHRGPFFNLFIVVARNGLYGFDRQTYDADI